RQHDGTQYGTVLRRLRDLRPALLADFRQRLAEPRRNLREGVLDHLALAQRFERRRLPARKSEEARLWVGGREPVDRSGHAGGWALDRIERALVARGARPARAAVDEVEDLVRGACKRRLVRGLREAKPAAFLARLALLDREDRTVPGFGTAPALAAIARVL